MFLTETKILIRAFKILENVCCKRRNTIGINEIEKSMIHKREIKFQERIKKPYKLELVWSSIIVFLIGHLAALYGTYLLLIEAKIWTTVWMWSTVYASILSITMGVHRLYSHKAFKANRWIRFILVAMQAFTGQRSLWKWVRDHRLHHKFSDTDADPHNSKRGFFFSHVGWLLVRKHPEVIIKGRTIDMSDMDQDAMIMFQKKHFEIIFTLLGVVFPWAVPCLLWNETLWNSFFISVVSRWIYSLNITWFINSIAHAYGTKPFNKDIIPVENSLASLLTLGEGWHNYHHSFPWDYRTAEFGQHFNATTVIIDYCAKKGWVYDLKCASVDLVRRCATKIGDGSHPVYGKFNPNEVLESEEY